MGRIFQLRTKIKINSKVDAGVIFQVPSFYNDHPNGSELVKALEKQFGVNAGMYSDWSPSKYEILSTVNPDHF